MKQKINFNLLKILFLSINFMQLIFIVCICYLIQDSYIVSWDYDEPLFIISILFCLSSLFLQSFIFKKSLKHIENKIYEDKLETYLKLFIFRLAILEASTLFSSILALINTNLAFIFIALPSLFLSVTIYPSKHKIIEDTKLNAEERKRFYKEF